MLKNALGFSYYTLGTLAALAVIIAAAIVIKTSAEVREKLPEQVRDAASGELAPAADKAEVPKVDTANPKLDADFVPGQPLPEASVVLWPDDVNDLADAFKSNALAARQEYGDERLVIAVWVDGIEGTNEPVLHWRRGRCELDQSPANLQVAANYPKVDNADVIVSGYVDWEYGGRDYINGGLRLTECRVHDAPWIDN